MKSPLPPDRVAALLKVYAKPKPKPQKPKSRFRRIKARKFDRLANLGNKAKRVLTLKAVRDIRKRWNDGEKLEAIASDHGVSKAYVSMVGSGVRRWEVKA